MGSQGFEPPKAELFDSQSDPFWLFWGNLPNALDKKTCGEECSACRESTRVVTGGVLTAT